MARQKQVDECLERCLGGQNQPTGHKLSATVRDDLLTMYHYHHKLLVYHMRDHNVLFEWWEKPTDRRILEAAVAFLKDRKKGETASISKPSDALAANHNYSPDRKGSSVTQLVRTERLVIGHHGDCQLAHGDSIEDRASVFVAHIAFPVKSEAAAKAAIARMRQHRSASSANHNISAFRVLGSSSCVNDVASGCDDDGEDRAGTKLLSTLRTEKALDVAVVVSRWYGGTNLGKVRFQHISDAARRLLSSCGHRPAVSMSERAAFEWGHGHLLGSSDSSSSAPVPLVCHREARRELIAAAAERRAALSTPAPIRVASSSFERAVRMGQGSGKRFSDEEAGKTNMSPHKIARLTSEVSGPHRLEESSMSEALASRKGSTVWQSLKPRQASRAIELDD